MTTETVQHTEAAEQFRQMLETMDPQDAPNPGVLAARLDHAIAYERRDERRLTVERIREWLVKAVESRDFMSGPLQPSVMLAILDEVADRP